MKQKNWRAKIYYTTQRTNWQILTSAKKIQFWPSTHIIDAASFVKIASNSGQAEVIARSRRYQTLWTDKNWSKNYSSTNLVWKWTVMTVQSCQAVNSFTAIRVWAGTIKLTLVLFEKVRTHGGYQFSCMNLYFSHGGNSFCVRWLVLLVVSELIC